MKRTWNRFIAVFTFVVFSVNASVLLAATPGVALIGRGSVSGSATDRSGLKGNICQAGVPANCVPRSILGGFGSDITYTGHDNVFVAAPDRGPFDGLTDISYLNRFHFFHITTEVGADFPNIRAVLLDTRFFKNEFGDILIGATGDFANRFDPEGIRVGANGNFYISDEYGPYVIEFDRQGNLVRRIEVPSKFFIANPSSIANNELTGNSSGRQANRGMEGLAISPDGQYLFGIMQNALIQDNGLNGLNRVGLNNRILKIDLATGETHEYTYAVDVIGGGQGTCEILAINDHELLVLERDNRIGNAAVSKKIYKIDLTGAVDVSDQQLPATISPNAIAKSLFIDLLDPLFGLKPTMPEKIEGLAWGPDLEDGSHVLYVVSDNDLMPAQATQIYSFSIAPEVLDFQEQLLPGPFYPPGQVQKELKAAN